ncbi:MAG: MMPL family transporter [Acidimicrobiales bacterium]
MNAAFTRLGRLVVRFRWLVLVIWLVGTVASVKLLPSLASQVNNDNSAFLPANSPSVRAMDLAAPLGVSSGVSQVVIVAYSAAGPLGPADQAAIAREVTAVHRIPGVVAVHLLGVAPDGHAAEVDVGAKVAPTSVNHAKVLVDRLQATFASVGAPPGLQLRLAGAVATNVANQTQSKKTGSRVQSLSILFIIVLLLLVYRSLLAPFVTLFPAALVLAMSGSFIGALGSRGLQISEVTQVLLIVLILGAGTDYGLFLVFRVREELSGGLLPKEAVVRALTRVGESISASAGTVILALLSLLFATFGIYHDLGIPLAIGIAVMLLAGLTLLPALLAILGRAVFWPSRAHKGPARQGLWGRIAARVVHRPALALLVGVLAFGAMAGAVSGYHAAGFGGAVSAPAGSDAAAGNAAMAKYFPRSSSNPTNLILRYRTSIWSDPTVLTAAESSLGASGQFHSLIGPLDPLGVHLAPAELAHLHQLLGPARAMPTLPPAGLAAVGITPAEYYAYRATAELVSPGGHTVQFEASLEAGPPQSTAAMDAVPAVRAALARAAEASGAVANGVAGEAPALADVSSTSNHDVLHIIPLAALAIALLLALVLRSLVAPLYLIASVVISYLAALGLAVVLFIDLGGSGGVTFLLPFLMFIFLLALGEDYNILVMTRIREEASAMPLRDAVTKAVGMTGPTVTSAGLVLAGSFAVLGFSGGGGSAGSQIQDIGFGLAIGILMDTFLVRTILVPSTVALLGKWNWWPTRLDHSGTTMVSGTSKESPAPPVAVP